VIPLLTNNPSTSILLVCLKHEGKPTDQFRCRVPHPLRYQVDPTRHEFRPLKFEFSKECLQILEECGIYDPNPETVLSGKLEDA
jgi:hypothetical protein